MRLFFRRWNRTLLRSLLQRYVSRYGSAWKRLFCNTARTHQSCSLAGTDSAAASHLHNGCGRYCLWNGDSAVYDVDLLFMRHHGSDSGSLAGHGTFGGTYDIVHYRYGGNENLLDLRSIPNAPVVDGTVFILSGLLAGNDPAAGDMFLFCQKESTQHHAAGRTIISGRFSGVKVPG